MASDDERFLTATYEEKVKMMAVMSDTDREAAAENVLHICEGYCGKCPTYQGTGEVWLAFCALGKSTKIRVSHNQNDVHALGVLLYPRKGNGTLRGRTTLTYSFISNSSK
jgi:hypothetical protein